MSAWDGPKPPVPIKEREIFIEMAGLGSEQRRWPNELSVFRKCHFTDAAGVACGTPVKDRSLYRQQGE